MPDKISARAKRLWLRLCEWYGARMREQYGDAPPEDWAAVVDRSDNDAVKRALSIIRQNHVEHPPTFPQFEKAFRPPAVSHTDQAPTIQERLCEHAMKTLGMVKFGGRLTPKQVRLPWEYAYKRRQWTDNISRSRDELAECVAVVIPADGDSCGHRITVEDMERASDAAP